MKTAAVTIIVLIAFFGLAAQTSGQKPGEDQRKRISVLLTTAAVRTTEHTRTDVLLIWNRQIRDSPIGNAIKSCIEGGTGGILGKNGLMTCTLIVQLPLGKVAASGVIHNVRRYTLVTTGGTGIYEQVSGPLYVRSVAGDGVRRMTFSIP